jgi:hypothetical protein
MRRLYCLGLSWSVLAAAALLAACGGSQPAATTPAEPGAAPAGEAPAGEAPGGAELTWSDDMPVKDKATFMKQKVMPVMGKVFKDHDAAKYEKFSCKTAGDVQVHARRSLAQDGRGVREEAVRPGHQHRLRLQRLSQDQYVKPPA